MPDDEIWEPVGIDDFLDEEEPEYDWIVEGLLERRDRVILTGREGKGKSTLMRQFGMMLASGVHPFTGEIIEPKRVLLLDLENSRSQLRRALGPMRELLSGYDSQFSVLPIPAGLDLTRVDDVLVGHTALAMTHPDLLLIGPMYKMGVDLTTEGVSGLVRAQLDKWRDRFNCALIIESHQPHEQVSQAEGRFRPERPFGSSLWMRWPEFGICLEDNGTLRHWRGQRDERDWPERLHWGRTWPWEAGQPECLQCGVRLAEGQNKYCSERCGNAWRQARRRARMRGAAE